MWCGSAPRESCGAPALGQRGFTATAPVAGPAGPRPRRRGRDERAERSAPRHRPSRFRRSGPLRSSVAVRPCQRPAGGRLRGTHVVWPGLSGTVRGAEPAPHAPVHGQRRPARGVRGPGAQCRGTGRRRPAVPAARADDPQASPCGGSGRRGRGPRVRRAATVASSSGDGPAPSSFSRAGPRGPSSTGADTEISSRTREAGRISRCAGPRSHRARRACGARAAAAGRRARHAPGPASGA